MPDQNLLDVAYGLKPADTVVAGGRLVNVLSGEIYQADVAVAGTRIAAVGDIGERRGPGTRVIDAGGRYLTPGLIDAHLHIECSKLSVTMFAGLVVPYGTTSAVSGLDQILVVSGLPGVREFLDESARTPLRIFWGAPAKAPYTVPTSTVGHAFGPAEHRQVQSWAECIGVWETVQEFIEHRDADVLAAFDLAEGSRLPVFGCAPMASPAGIWGQAAAGVWLDHESYSAEETLAKLRNGINVIVRESAAAPFLAENIRVITEFGANAGRVAFCTDDISASDVLGRGHLDRLIRMATAAGVPPVTAIQMATINCASMYRIDHLVGSVAPGRYADLLLVDDLADFRPHKVIAGGQEVAVDGHMMAPPQPPQRSAQLRETIRVSPAVTADQLAPRSGHDRVAVLALSLSPDMAFVRKRKDAVLEVRDGLVQAGAEGDILYATVVERYGKNGNRPVAFVHGFGLREGAIATSAAPDDNNIVCVGADREDMALAIAEITRAGGGQVVVRGGEVAAMLPLPVGGIVADLPPAEMAEREQELDRLAREMGSALSSPFWYLMFLSITAIPDYAVTDLGLVDCVRLEITDPVLGPA